MTKEQEAKIIKDVSTILLSNGVKINVEGESILVEVNGTEKSLDSKDSYLAWADGYVSGLTYSINERLNGQLS
jgi:hypothetical protein